MTKSSKSKIDISPQQEPLRNKIIVIAELRMALAEFTKEGISEITMYDFLVYLSGLMHEAKAIHSI